MSHNEEEKIYNVLQTSILDFFVFFISNKIIKSSKGKNVCILFLHRPKLFFFLCFLSHFFKFWKLEHYQETQLHHVVIDLSMNTFMNFTSWRVQFCQYLCLMTYTVKTVVKTDSIAFL